MARLPQGQWRVLIAEQTASGQTAMAFSAERGIDNKYFSTRKKQLGIQPAESRFVAITTNPLENQSLLNQAQGMLKIEINVNIASGWTNGFSWSSGGTKLITCARRTQWEDMPSNTKEYTWNHEVGHRFGMVAFGDKLTISGHNKLPDGPSTLYGENRGVNGKEHKGPHCEKGAAINAATKTWSGTPGCVMFGANGTGTAHAPKEYCSECTPIVRKLDLSA